MIDFPASPTVGQIFTAAGVTWIWDGAKWAANGVGVPYLPLSGGILTGPLTLAGDPVNLLDAATKQYVDGKSLVSHANRIINGDMRIDQRSYGAAFVPTVSGYGSCDRWASSVTQASKLSFQRGTFTPATLGATGFGYCLGCVTAVATVPAAADIFAVGQRIEADLIVDFGWGTPQAQPVTLSFWACSTILTGAFGGSIRNTDGTRSYPFTFNLPTANTWTKITVTIPGDTAGTWVLQGNGIGAFVQFDLGSGSNYRAAAGAWATGSFMAPTGAVNSIGTLNNSFYFTGVKLEVGSVTTPFDRQTLAKSLADCQRYYQPGNVQAAGYGTASMAFANMFPFTTQMRAAPTITPNFTINVNASTPAVNPVGSGGYQVSGVATAIGNFNLAGTFTASAEL